MKIINVIIIAIWTLSGLYYGVGGYMSIVLLDQKEKAELGQDVGLKIDDTIYRNMDQYKWFHNKKQLETVFPWLIKVPQSLAIIIAALSFGILGGVTRLIKQIAFDDGVTLENIRAVSIPTLGMLSGIIMLGVTFIIPTVLTSGEQELRPTTLIFLTLFAGLFAKRFYEWLSTCFHIIFPQPKQ